MKKIFKEFKEFINKGNATDLAVGMIIGAAFTAIVNSFVKDIISPIIGLFTRKNFDGVSVSIGNVSINYGSFVMSVINFLLTALVLFVFVKIINRIKGDISKHTKDEDAKTKLCPYCKSVIDINATRCPHCTSKLGDKK